MPRKLATKEKLTRLLLEGLNIGAKDIKGQVPDPGTTMTPLQLAYGKQKDCNFFPRVPAEKQSKLYEFLLIADEIITAVHRLVGHSMVGLRCRFGDCGIASSRWPNFMVQLFEHVAPVFTKPIRCCTGRIKFLSADLGGSITSS